MTDAGTTQDNFILLHHLWEDCQSPRTGLTERSLFATTPFQSSLPSRKNILVNMVFKISIGYTNLDMRKIQSLLDSREKCFLFNDALNTFYIRLYGVRHMVKDHSDSEKGNPLPPHRLLLSINSKGSFIYTIPQTG